MVGSNRFVFLGRHVSDRHKNKEKNCVDGHLGFPIITENSTDPFKGDSSQISFLTVNR